MFHSRQINNKINKLHERALKFVYNDHFEELLSKDKSVTLHQRNQIVATEMYKTLNGLSPDIMQDIFETIIILVMRKHFPQEILQQLDMDYRPSLTWLQIFGTLRIKR